LGTAGGQPGSTGSFTIRRGNETLALHSKSEASLKPGDVVSIVVGGGGGYGPPQARSADAVRADLESGKVTVATPCVGDRQEEAVAS
jgi:N-methylhydantoinase B